MLNLRKYSLKMIPKKVDCILIDLSGTLLIDNQPTKNAVEALKKLRKLNIPHIRFVTNTTKESTNTLLDKLTKIGFNITADEIHSSLLACAKYVEEKKLNPFYIVTDDSLKDLPISANDNFDSVVVGLAPEKFNYHHINNAFKVLLNGGQLIAIHEGRYYKTKDEMAVGPGFVVKGLEFSSGVTSTVMGKPNEYFFKSSLPKNVEPENCLMIGDDVYDDIIGAQTIGIKGFLVRSGKIFNEKAPDFPECNIFDDFNDVVEFIHKHISERKSF